MTLDPEAGYFEDLYRQAPFGYVITGSDDIVVRVNQTLLAWTGLEETQIVGRPFRELLSSGSQLLYETRHLPVLRLQGFVQEVVLQMNTASGAPLPVLINAAAVGDGGDAGVRIGVLDASSRISYERELLSTQRIAESLAAKIAVLQNASVAFEGSTSETEIAQTLASIVEDALVATAACVAVVRPSGQLEVIAGDNRLAGLIRVQPGLLGDTVLAGELAVIVSAGDDDAERYPSLIDALHDARLQTVAVFPMMSDSAPAGVIAAFFARERSLSASETELVASVARQASQVLTRMRAQEQLAFAARHDQLTGLPNRALIRETIERELVSAAEEVCSLSVMFIDLDGFKAVNDTLGHHAGDAILREVARRLTSSVRSSDVVGRYGGDEFVVICCDTDGSDAAVIAARIHEVVREAYADAESFPISASIGLAVHEPSRAIGSLDGIIGAADAAMYESKRLGRDRTTQVAV